MKCRISRRHAYVCRPTAVTLFILLLSLYTSSQEKRAVKGEAVTCHISIGDASTRQGAAAGPVKNYTPLVNQSGYFDKISNIKPYQKVAVQVAYPKGARGEKAWVIVLDGGTLDNNRKEQVVQLDAHRRLAFNFHAGKSPGIYRIVLRKASDTKIIQLWVGPETATVKR
jgi:hypothetical protein